MSVVISKSDFIGKYGIKQTKPMLNGTEVALGLDSFIQEKEEGTLIDLMGADLFLAFKANPSDPIYTPLYDLGLKLMLIKFVYFEYYRSNTQNSSTGQVVSKGETVKPVNSGADRANCLIYNEAVKTYNVISEYISSNRATYTQFKSNVHRKTTIFL